MFQRKFNIKFEILLTKIIDDFWAPIEFPFPAWTSSWDDLYLGFQVSFDGRVYDDFLVFKWVFRSNFSQIWWWFLKWDLTRVFRSNFSQIWWFLKWDLTIKVQPSLIMSWFPFSEWTSSWDDFSNEIWREFSDQI